MIDEESDELESVVRKHVNYICHSWLDDFGQGLPEINEER
jgi:hypothetical protein